jgi:hypothetical protein
MRFVCPAPAEAAMGKSRFRRHLGSKRRSHSAAHILTERMGQKRRPATVTMGAVGW